MDIVSATDKATADEVRASQVFKNWAGRVKGWPIPLVTIDDAFSWGGAIRMLLLRVAYGGNDHAILLRGSAVDIVTVLRCEGQQYLVHVDQPRVAVGQIVRSNAAGMVDDNEQVAVAALRELAEETGVSLDWGKPLNLNEIVYGIDVPELGTPGGSDEDVTFFAVTAYVTADDLAKFNDRVSGLAAEGEQTTVRLTPFDGPAASALPQLVVNGQRPDMKASHSLLMYDWATQLLRQNN